MYRQRSGDWLPKDAIRQAVEESDLSLNQIALRLGWRKGGKRSDLGDVTRLSRRLGLKPESDGRTTRTLRYDLAVAIVEAIDRDPIDFDL